MRKRLFLYSLFCIYGCNLFGQEKIELVIVPDNKVVTKGFPYHAKIYVLAAEFLEKTKDNLIIDTKVKGLKLERFPNYYDLMIPTDSILRSFEREKEVFYKLTLKNQVFEGSFKVKIPQIIPTVSNTGFLYNQSGNVLYVEIANWEYSDDYELTYSTTNGEINAWDDESRDRFLIIPKVTETTNNRQCEVSIGALLFGKKHYIGKLIYPVYEPPKPVLQLLKQGRVQDCDKSVKKGEEVGLHILPDDVFKSIMPLDARYIMSDITMSLESFDGKPINGESYLGEILTTGAWKKTESNNTIYFDVTSNERLNIPIPKKLFAADAPKCRLKIYIGKVAQQNFKGKIIEDNRFSEEERTFYVGIEK